jgi:hypothetical protein
MVSEQDFAAILDRRLKRIAELEAKPINGNPQLQSQTIDQPQIETPKRLPTTNDRRVRRM